MHAQKLILNVPMHPLPAFAHLCLFYLFVFHIKAVRNVHLCSGTVIIFCVPHPQGM